MTNPWLLLGTAIVAEGIGTSALKASAGFTRLGPSFVVAGYGVAFYLMSLSCATSRPAWRTPPGRAWESC